MAKLPVEDTKSLKALTRTNQILNRISGQLDQLNRNLTASTESLIALEHEQMATLEDVRTEITENGSAVDSAVSLLDQLAQMIRDNATDPDALAALADELDANNQRLAAAVTANTPAAEGGEGEGGGEPAPA